MTHETIANDNIEGLRLFQVTFAEWGPPVCVVASNFKHAAEIATSERGAERDARSMLVWDATDDWKNLSTLMHAHTMTVLDQGRTGIALYDEDAGWSVSSTENDCSRR